MYNYVSNNLVLDRLGDIRHIFDTYLLRADSLDEVFFFWKHVTKEQFTALVETGQFMGPEKGNYAYDRDAFKKERSWSEKTIENYNNIYSEETVSDRIFAYCKFMVKYIENYMKDFDLSNIREMQAQHHVMGNSSVANRKRLGNDLHNSIRRELGFIEDHNCCLIYNYGDTHFKVMGVFNQLNPFIHLVRMFSDCIRFGRRIFSTDHVLSRKEDFRVEVYDNQKEFQKFFVRNEVNRNKVLKAGKLLKKYFGFHLDDAQIERLAAVITNKFGTIDMTKLHLHMSLDGDNFQYATTTRMQEKYFGDTTHMVKSQANSCMRYSPSKFELKTHPSRVYATGDFMVAYLSDSADPLDPKANLYGRCYIGIQYEHHVTDKEYRKNMFEGENKKSVVFTLCPIYTNAADHGVMMVDRIKEALQKDDTHVGMCLSDNRLPLSENHMGLVGLKLNRIVEGSNLIMPYLDQELYLDEAADKTHFILKPTSEEIRTGKISDLKSESDKVLLENYVETHFSRDVKGDPVAKEANKQKLTDNIRKLIINQEFHLLRNYPSARLRGGSYKVDVRVHNIREHTTFKVTMPHGTINAYLSVSSLKDFNKLKSTTVSGILYMPEDEKDMITFDFLDPYDSKAIVKNKKDFSFAIPDSRMHKVVRMSAVDNQQVISDRVYVEDRANSEIVYDGRRYQSVVLVDTRNMVSQQHYVNIYNPTEVIVVHSGVFMKLDDYMELLFGKDYVIYYSAANDHYRAVSKGVHERNMAHHSDTFHRRQWELKITAAVGAERPVLFQRDVFRNEYLNGGRIYPFSSSFFQMNYIRDIAEKVPRQSAMATDRNQTEMNLEMEVEGDRLLVRKRMGIAEGPSSMITNISI